VLTVVGLLIALPLVLSGAWQLVVYSVARWHTTAYTETVASTVLLVADGKVEVSVDPDATQVVVKAKAWYAWGWQAPTYASATRGDELEIRHKCDSFPIGPSCEAGLVVVLPPDTQLVVLTTYGRVTASDLVGPVNVSSGDGRVQLEHITGDVIAHSGNGRIEISDIAGSVDAHSSDGAVVVDSVRGDVNARSGNGRLEISDVRGSVGARSGDGAVVVRGVGGDVLDARSGNGSVEVSDVTGSVVASSADGHVFVHGAGGDVEAQSGNGRVEVIGAGGSVSATSSDGSVLVEEVAGNVMARSGNGRVTVYGPGVPVSLSISSGNGGQRIEAATEPFAQIRVTIHSNDGSVAYLPPRGLPTLAVVPQVVDLLPAAADAALTAAGFSVVVVEVPYVYGSSRGVVSSDPEAGHVALRGSVVTIVVPE